MCLSNYYALLSKMFGLHCDWDRNASIHSTKGAGVVAIWLLHCNWYVGQHYSECYNRDVQVHSLKSKSRKFLQILENFSPQNIPAIWYIIPYQLIEPSYMLLHDAYGDCFIEKLSYLTSYYSYTIMYCTLWVHIYYLCNALKGC